MRRFFRNLFSVALVIGLCCLSRPCAAARPWLQDLNAQEQGELSSLILSYLSDDEIHWHMNINHRDPQSFFHGHRAYLQRLERYLQQKGAGRFVPLPKWDPARPIPEPFRVVRFDFEQLQNPAVGLPVPMAFRGPMLQQFDDLTNLFEAINPYHNEVHARVGGCMGDPMTAPAAPIFFCWHALLDDVFSEWAGLHGYRIPASFEREFPDHSPHGGPTGAPDQHGPVDNAPRDHGCICGPNCRCGPSCQCPPRQQPPPIAVPGGCPRGGSPTGGCGSGGQGNGGYGNGGYGNHEYPGGFFPRQFPVPEQGQNFLKRFRPN